MPRGVITGELEFILSLVITGDLVKTTSERTCGSRRTIEQSALRR